jgi:hypothetical protein
VSANQELYRLLKDGVKWSGFSGQGPSLTSEAGHRPNHGLSNNEHPTHPQPRV